MRLHNSGIRNDVRLHRWITVTHVLSTVHQLGGSTDPKLVGVLQKDRLSAESTADSFSDICTYVHIIFLVCIYITHINVYNIRINRYTHDIFI